MKLIKFILIFIIPYQAFGHGADGDAGANVGKDKGVTAVSEKDGMTLAPEAIKRLDIKTTALVGNPPWTVARSSLVFSKEDVSIYREENGNYKAVLIDATKKPNDVYQINSWQLEPQDNIVTQGAELLRVSELDAGGGHKEEEEEGHDDHSDHDEHDEDKHNESEKVKSKDSHEHDHKEGDHD